MAVTGMQSDRIIRLRELAREAADTWPDDEERTNPVIVNVMHAPKQSDKPALAQSAEKIVIGVRSWVQVAALAIIAGLAAYLLK